MVGYWEAFVYLFFPVTLCRSRRLVQSFVTHSGQCTRWQVLYVQTGSVSWAQRVCTTLRRPCRQLLRQRQSSVSRRCGVHDADCCGSRNSIQPNHSVLAESSRQVLAFADTWRRVRVGKILTLRDGSITLRDEVGVDLKAQDPSVSMQIGRSWSSQSVLRRWTKSIFGSSTRKVLSVSWLRKPSCPDEGQLCLYLLLVAES